MSYDNVTFGYTYREDEVKETEQAEAVISRHLEAVRSFLPEIDEIGFFFPGDYDERGYDEAGQDHLGEVLLNGWTVHADEAALLTDFFIPGGPKETPWVFRIISDAVDEFDYMSFSILLGAIEHVPALGQELGIIGAGIHNPLTSEA